MTPPVVPRRRAGAGPRVRGFVTRVVNPIVLRLGLAGGRRSAWAAITTVGRRSGRQRTNPVLPHVFGGLLVIPLSYGHDVQRARNVAWPPCAIATTP